MFVESLTLGLRVFAEIVPLISNKYLGNGTKRTKLMC